MLQEMLCTVCLLRCCWADKKRPLQGRHVTANDDDDLSFLFFLSNICWHLLTCWTVCCKWENASRWGAAILGILFSDIYIAVECSVLLMVSIFESVFQTSVSLCTGQLGSQWDRQWWLLLAPLSLSLFLFAGDKLLRIFHSLFLFYSLFGFHMTQKEGGCSVADKNLLEIGRGGNGEILASFPTNWTRRRIFTLFRAEFR